MARGHRSGRHSAYCAATTPDTITRVEDVVAIRLDLDTGEARYLMCWGRIPDRVDTAPLEAMALAASSSFPLGGNALKATVCASLLEASGEMYFHEGLWYFAQQPIPRDDGYQAWKAERLREFEAGNGFYYLGKPAPSPPPQLVTGAPPPGLGELQVDVLRRAREAIGAATLSMDPDQRKESVSAIVDAACSEGSLTLTASDRARIVDEVVAMLIVETG